MRGPNNQQHIPIDIVRTVVAISETGSLSKAGEKLGISQPAVSAQIKRIEQMIGGELFDKTSNGATATELGKLALQQARKILEANDQMLRLGVSGNRPEIIRLGLVTMFAPHFVKTRPQDTFANIFIHTDSATRLAKSFADGFVDVACFVTTPDAIQSNADTVVKTFEVDMVWVRSPNFVLSPGKPIPLLGWPGLVTDDMLIRTLESRGLAYRIAFNSADFQARLAAAEAGLGLSGVPARLVPPTLMVAKELYLPQLPPLIAHICVRPGLGRTRVGHLVEALSDMFRNEE